MLPLFFILKGVAAVKLTLVETSAIGYREQPLPSSAHREEHQLHRKKIFRMKFYVTFYVRYARVTIKKIFYY